jgi:hypothetical protein
MPDDHEQQIWEDIQRYWAEEAEEPPRSEPVGSTGIDEAAHAPADVPIAVALGVRIVIVLLLFGAAPAALAVAVATALVWALSRGRGQDVGDRSDGSARDVATRAAAQESAGTVSGGGRRPDRQVLHAGARGSGR